MPDVNVNPSAISTQADSVAPNGKDGTPAPPKPPPLTTSTSQKGSKPAQVCPRIDIEPLYTALKSGIGDNWTTYRDAVSRFILGACSSCFWSRFLPSTGSQDDFNIRMTDKVCAGHLTITEFFCLTSPFLHSSDTLLHQHNQLVLALTINITREAPEPGVAPWVSANDKPTSTAKPLAGDAAEHRLKHEVMQLPPRVRARIKATNDEPAGALTGGLASELHARRLPVSSGVGGAVSTPLAAVPPGSASSTSTGLNKDQEIKKRYHQSLMQESQDLPTKSAISDRVLPICYEHGLMNGIGQAGTVSSYLSAAMHAYLKEYLGEILAVTRINPPLSHASAGSGSGPSDTIDHSIESGSSGSILGICTAGYKKGVAREAAQARDGHVKRNEAGLLPIERQAQQTSNWGRGREGDARLAWELKAPRFWSSRVPWAGEKVGFQNEYELESDKMLDLVSGGNGTIARGRPNRTLLNGMPRKSSGGQMQVDGVGAPPMVNGDTTMTNHDRDEGAIAIDEADWGWQGVNDPMALDDLLDGCLDV